jgi:AcrR family transcriptional regulator
MHMPVNSPPRTLRAEQAEETRRRILSAAEALFLSKGYAAATLQAVAAAAGVAVETVYSRFGNKTNLLAAILEKGLVATEDGQDILQQPEVERIRRCADQGEQLRLLAAFSRGLLERTDGAHRILRSAAAVEGAAAELQQRDNLRRVEGQRVYIEMLLANGPLREGLSADEAADTYSALASPETFAFLTGDRGWTPDRFERWLAETLARSFLPA